MAKKEAKKKTVKKAAPSKSKSTGSDGYVCEVCGLTVSVDEACGCVETYDLIFY